MTNSPGRPAIAVSLPNPPSPPAPAWLQVLVSGLVQGKMVSAAVAVLGDASGELAAAAAGDALPPPGGGRPLFDLASLSKLWTASLALRLDARGLLPLDVELGELWPKCAPRLARRTLEDLLRHRAGFRSWTPLYRRCRRRSTVAKLLLDGQLLGARRGTYSDLDYILWGLTAERALGRSMGALLREELVAPLGLCAEPSGGTIWLPCRLDNEREMELAAAQDLRVGRRDPPATGQVQDGNARFLGAPAGHAGLFATPGALLALVGEWLAPGALWSAAINDDALSGAGPFFLGWRRPTKRGSAGPALGPRAYGHLGFTGGSVWVDPDRDRALILLAHRSGVDVDLAPARRRFHTLAMADYSSG